jgi:hypothetical protein
MATLSYDYPDSDSDRGKCRDFIQNFRENGRRKYYHLLVFLPFTLSVRSTYLIVAKHC